MHRICFETRKPRTAAVRALTPLCCSINSPAIRTFSQAARDGNVVVRVRRRAHTAGGGDGHGCARWATGSMPLCSIHPMRCCGLAWPAVCAVERRGRRPEHPERVAPRSHFGVAPRSHSEIYGFWPCNGRPHLELCTHTYGLDGSDGLFGTPSHRLVRHWSSG